MQYFQIKLNFSIKDQSHMFVLAGLCGMFTQLVLLRLLLRYISKRDLLLVGRIRILQPTKIPYKFGVEVHYKPVGWSFLPAVRSAKT